MHILAIVLVGLVTAGAGVNLVATFRQSHALADRLGQFREVARKDI